MNHPVSPFRTMPTDDMKLNLVLSKVQKDGVLSQGRALKINTIDSISQQSITWKVNWIGVFYAILEKLEYLIIGNFRKSSL